MTVTSAARIAARRRAAVAVAVAMVALTPAPNLTYSERESANFIWGGWLRAVELQDVEPGVIVGEIHDTLRIDKAVAGLDHSRPVGTRVEHMLGIGRHEEPGLARLERVLDVEDPHTGIVIGREDKARALKGARPVLPEIMRPEIAAFGAVVGLGRDRHRGEAHRIGRLAHIEEPDVADALAAIGEIGLVGKHQEVAIGERQWRMRAAAKGRIEVAMGEELGPGRIADVEHGEPTVAPGGIGEVAGDQRMVQRVAAALRPTRRLAARPHAGDPPLA